MRIAAIFVTVGTLETQRKRIRNDDGYEDGCFDDPKTTTVSKMATPRGPIPVLLGILEAYKGGELGVRRIPCGGLSNREPWSRDHI